MAITIEQVMVKVASQDKLSPEEAQVLVAHYQEQEKLAKQAKAALASAGVAVDNKLMDKVTHIFNQASYTGVWVINWFVRRQDNIVKDWNTLASTQGLPTVASLKELLELADKLPTSYRNAVLAGIEKGDARGRRDYQN